MENDVPGMLRVEVAYAAPEGPWLRSLSLPAGATLAQALEASGLAQAFPGLDPYAHGVGIYGRLCPAGQALADGDRVEVYRPLRFDPKESRRRRAEHRRARAAAQGRNRPPGLL
ncbi:RnfH family protein [Bordetella sp. 2513F-2]